MEGLLGLKLRQAPFELLLRFNQAGISREEEFGSDLKLLSNFIRHSFNGGYGCQKLRRWIMSCIYACLGREGAHEVRKRRRELLVGRPASISLWGRHSNRKKF